MAFAVQIVPDLLLGARQQRPPGPQRVDLSRAADARPPPRRWRRPPASPPLAGGGLRGVALASLVVSVIGSIVALVLLWGSTSPTGACG